MLNQFTLAEATKPAMSGKLATLTAGAASNGAAVNTKGYRRAKVDFITGTVGSGGTVDGKVQESDDGSSGWTDVPNAAITQLADTADDVIASIDINLQGRKLFLRTVITPATANVIAGGVITLYRPDGMPQGLPIAQSIAPKYA